MTPLINANGDARVRICDACGKQEWTVVIDDLSHEFIYAGRHQTWQYALLECNSCGLGLVDPKPTAEFIKSLYDEEYGSFDSHSPANNHNGNSIKFRLARMRGARFGDRGLSALTRASLGCLAEWVTGKTISYTLSFPLQLDRDSRIFDVGYGSGNWLVALSEMGYCNLYGYDIAANMRHVSRLHSAGVTVSSGVFVNNDYPAAAFDCIRMEHVFEHLPNPIEVLKQCYRMLRPGGILVMSFPCKDSWSFRLSIRDSPALQVPKHLFHHTQQSAKAMLEAAGFTLFQITAYSVSSQLAGTVNKLLGNRHPKAIPFLFEMVSPVYRLFGSVTGKGDFLTLCAVRGDAAYRPRAVLPRSETSSTKPA
jgi:2-polyprenyl-3-methyl-5-hydroxy-6-metoxy-1,4-benzoquinol methylase